MNHVEEGITMETGADVDLKSFTEEQLELATS